MKKCDFCNNRLAQFECDQCYDFDGISLMCAECKNKHNKEYRHKEINLFIE